MEYRKLGNSGMYVSEITYGNWITHGSQVDSESAKKCVRAALDAGITTFDTADSYAFGRAETVLGKSLKSVKRESYELITKIYWPTGEGKNDRGLSRKHIFESFHASLDRLQTDHVDVLICHRFDHETPLEETLSAFNDILRQGKAHYIGVSEWNAQEISQALAIQDAKGYTRFVTNQAQYSALYRVIEKEVVPLAKKEGIGHIVFSPLCQGVLTGKYQPGKKPPANSRANDKNSLVGGAEFITGWLREDVLTAVQKLKPIAADLDISMAQLALAWVLNNTNVSSAIMGATSPAQVKDNAKGAGIKLTSDVVSEMNKILNGLAETDPKKNQSPNPRA
jgi:aryl-alcohol dehydrogenase-like predicted oxidoreductase